MFMLIIGLIYGYYLVPIIVIAYTLVLTTIGSLIYVGRINLSIDGYTSSQMTGLARNWIKPYFSLFLYYAMDHLKIALVITKVLSASIILGSVYLLADVNNDLRVPGILMLG